MLLLPKTLEFSKTIKKLHKKLKLSQRLEIQKPRSSGKVEMAKKGKNQQLSTRAGEWGITKNINFWTLSTNYFAFKKVCIQKGMHSKKYAFKKICIQKGMHSKRYAFRKCAFKKVCIQKVCIQNVCIEIILHSKCMHSKCYAVNSLHSKKCIQKIFYGITCHDSQHIKRGLI